MFRCISAFSLIIALPSYYYLAYHFIPTLAEYQPQVYSNMLFPPDVQTCCSEGEDGLEFFDEEFVGAHKTSILCANMSSKCIE
jgi:hypothetical protein